MTVKEPALFDVQLRLNGSNHNDVLIRLGDREVVGDSYYFSLDNAYRPDDRGEEKVKELFARQSCRAAQLALR